MSIQTDYRTLGQRIRDAGIKKHGSLEAYKQFMSEIGTKGGKATSGYKFAYGKISPHEAGKLGGRVRSENYKRNRG